MEYVAGILYILAQGLVVTSVLLIQKRTLLVQAERLTHYMIGLSTAAWMVSFLVLWIIQVLPIQGFWLSQPTSKNIVNASKMNMARVIIEAFLLLATLYRVVPIPAKLSRRLYWIPARVFACAM